MCSKLSSRGVNAVKVLSSSGETDEAIAFVVRSDDMSLSEEKEVRRMLAMWFNMDTILDETSDRDLAVMIPTRSARRSIAVIESCRIHD